jgi:hypothetical protein
MSGKNGKITLERLYEEMQRGFARIDARFNEVDERFNEVDARFNQVDARFDKADRRFDEMLKNLGRYHRDHEARLVTVEAAVKRKVDR